MDYWNNFVAFIKEPIQFVFLLFGTYAALEGLAAWKKQLVGGRKFEVARNLMLKIYKLRESVRAARSPLITRAEMTNSKGELLSAPEGTNEAYRQRMEFVHQSMTDLSSELIEVELLFGKATQKKCEEILQKAWKFLNDIDLYIYFNSPYERDPVQARDILSKISRKLSSDGEPDDYEKEEIKLIQEVEKDMKSFLKD